MKPSPSTHIRMGGVIMCSFDFLCQAVLLSYRPSSVLEWTIQEYSFYTCIHRISVQLLRTTSFYKNYYLFIYLFILCVCIYASGNVWSEDSLVESFLSLHPTTPFGGGPGVEASAFSYWAISLSHWSLPRLHSFIGVFSFLFRLLFSLVLELISWVQTVLSDFS